MQGETCNDWVDRSIRAAVGGLADFLGLIGRNWLSVLGWSLFTMAISEPARAFGQDECPGYSGLATQCENWIASNPSQCSGFYVCECVETTSVQGSNQRYSVTTVQKRASDGAVWSYPQSTSVDCPLCSTQGPESSGGDYWNWPGGRAHSECFGGCEYVPNPNTACGETCAVVDGVETCSGEQCFPTSIQPNGNACAAGSDENPPAPEVPDDIPEAPPVCQEIADTGTVCIKPDAECDGYVGTLNGATICVPAGDDQPECNGPYCDDADPPGDADNKQEPEESNEDEPDAEFHYWYEDDGGDRVDDVDFFIPSADETGGCSPCPPAGDPDDPRDPDGPPPPDTDGDGIPDATDDDIDGDGNPNGDDDDTDGDGIQNGDDDDIDGDGVPNGDDDDDDGDGQSGSGGDGNGVDTDDNGDGTPDGVPEGDPDGECDPQTGQGCGDGEASGGARCDAPPVCTGDPVTCMVAYQAWETRCAVTGLEERIFDTEGMDDSTGTENVQPPDIQPFDTGGISFDDSGWLGGGGSCPDWTVSVMGSSYNLDESGHLCRFLQIGAGLVLVFAAWASARIIAGGIS